MNKIHFVLRSAFIIFASEKDKKIREMESKTFSVSGMKCPHCKANVEKALQSLQGVTFAEANLQAAEVRVEYDETLVSPEDIKQTVDNSGRYELTL